MKKSLLAVAAIGAFASAAQAQSSVTVYGILDVGFSGTSANTGTTKTQTTGFSGTGSEQTSRLGFKGNEDLGGGTSAFFTAEFALTPTEYNLSGNNSGGLANRQTFVGLAKKGIGQAAIGTQYMPIHTAVGRTDPGQQNNMLGNVIYVTNSTQGTAQTTVAYTVRVNNAITFQSERIAGAQLNAIYNNNNTDSTASNGIGGTGGKTINNAWGLGANYIWTNLNVDAVYQVTNQLTTSSTSEILPASATTSVTPNLLGTNIKSTEAYAGATYNFGILTAYAQYISRKISGQWNPEQFIKRSAQQIGVRSFVTPTIEVWASGGMGKYDGNTAQTVSTSPSSMGFTGYQVGSNYLLSKRTNLYAIFGSTQVKAGMGFYGESGNSYGVGVRHTF